MDKHLIHFCYPNKPGLHELLELRGAEVGLFLYKFSSVLFHSFQLISTHFHCCLVQLCNNYFRSASLLQLFPSSIVIYSFIRVVGFFAASLTFYLYHCWLTDLLKLLETDKLISAGGKDFLM